MNGLAWRCNAFQRACAPYSEPHCLITSPELRAESSGAVHCLGMSSGWCAELAGGAHCLGISGGLFAAAP